MSKELTGAVKTVKGECKNEFLFVKVMVAVMAFMAILTVSIIMMIESQPRYQKSMAWDYAVETNNETCKMLVKDYYEDEAFNNSVSEYTSYKLSVLSNEAERDEAKEMKFQENGSEYAVETCGVVLINY